MYKVSVTSGIKSSTWSPRKREKMRDGEMEVKNKKEFWRNNFWIISIFDENYKTYRSKKLNEPYVEGKHKEFYPKEYHNQIAENK